MKKTFWLFIVAAALMACNNNPTDPTTNPSTDTTTNVGDDDNDFVENQTWDYTVNIVWNGTSAEVSGLAEGVLVSAGSGLVTVTSTAKHISYVVSGTGTGQLKIYSDYKFRLELNDLTLTSTDGPAINNQCKKTCYVVLSGTNTLADANNYTASDESQKAALFSEGQLIFTGTGSLSVTGNYKHAVASDDYIRIREGNLSLTANASDGLHANDGIIIGGGNLTVSAAGDGIQCDTSSIVIIDGTVNITKAGDKGILAFGNILVSGGTVNVKSTDKGIKTQSDLEVQGGVITVIAGSSSSASYAPTFGPGGHGGNPGGGGWGSSGAEGIEAKGKMTFTGGIVFAQATDDAINSGGDMVINGGTVCAYSTGNDGLDANGNCYIQSGLVYAIGSGSPEMAVDANSEEKKQLYVQGGTLVAIGGLESGASLTQTCYSASSWSAGTWYALTYGSNTFAFLTPTSAGTPLVVSTGTSHTLKSGVTVSGGNTIFNGMGCTNASVSGGTEVSLSTYTGGNGGGRPGGW